MRSQVVAHSVSKQHDGVSSNCIGGVLEKKKTTDFFQCRRSEATSKLWRKIKDKNIGHKDITITMKTECLPLFSLSNYLNN